MALPPFERILEAHGEIVWRVCRAQAGPELADDVFQETMLAALRGYPELRDVGAVRGWLCTIAARKAIDARRGAARRPLPVGDDALALLADRLARIDGPEFDPVGDEQLWRRVRALPAKQRSVVTLRFLGDLSHGEIAELLGTSVEAARRSLHEGLERLRSHEPPVPDVSTT